MNTCITKYNCITNIGRNIEEVYKNALIGNVDKIVLDCGIIPHKNLCVGKVSDNNIQIKNPNYNLKCNRLLAECLAPMFDYINGLKQQNKKIGIVTATTNSGVEEFEKSQTPIHSEIGNPAMFLKEYLDITGYSASISTACTSGIKAFSIARNLIQSKLCDAVIVAGVDTLAKVPLYGFSSLEVLSDKHTNPLSRNRSGINIGEGAAVFVVEQEGDIEILGLGETTDTYHSTTPDPEAEQAIKAIELALQDAELQPENIDYINLHGTGTISNDLTEVKAVYNIFKDKTFCSSTKPLTGHCLGAAASIETALCCALIEKGGFYPHIYDGKYDETLPKINISNPSKETNICMNNAFGFGGTNSIMILGRGK